MEKITSIFLKPGIFNLVGLTTFFLTLYLGCAGLGMFVLSVIFIAVFEYFFQFRKKGIFTPYLLLICAPLLLINYSSVTDFRIRFFCFLLLVYIATAALTPAEKKIRFSLMKTRAPLIWFFAFIIFALAASVLYMRGIHLSGDEPHYIMITQSIVEDGDFDLKNNMEEKTYFKYLPVEINFHGGDYNGKFYSFHMPGVSFLLIPFYWLFGFLGKFVPPQLFFRLTAAVINAFFALGLFLLLKKIFPGKNITLFWLFFLALFPLIFHGVHLYPELPAAALLLYGYLFAFCEKRNYLLAGLFFSLIPWFHVKYIPAVVFLALIIIFKKFPAAAGKVKQFILFFLFPVVSLILLMVYSKSLYGSFNPAFIFPSEGYFVVPILTRIRTLFAYFFDQRDGLLFYAPLFFLAIFGLRRKFPDRGILVWTAVIYILFHANTTLRGAYSPAGRPVMFASWIFVILIINFYYSLEERKKSKTLFKLLSGLSVFTLTWLFYYPLFVYQPVFFASTERASGLLTFLGGSYINLSMFFPSFLSISNRGYIANYVWLGLLILALIIHYLLPADVPLLKIFNKKEKIFSFLVLLIFVFLLCFYPHIHLINKNKFSNKRISFFNNSMNFFYSEEREVFRIKTGNNYDIYFDLKRKGVDKVNFTFLNADQIDITVRNGSRVLFRSGEEKQGSCSFRLATLRKIKVKDKLVAHIGIETGLCGSKEDHFFFLKIE